MTARATATLDEAKAGGTGAPRSGLERAAWWLGLAGLIPFVGMAALLIYAGRDFIAFPQLVLALSGYGATILAFLGGIRWGAAIATGHPAGGGVLALSVLPSLAGWLILFAPAPWSFLAFAAAFALQGAWDIAAARRGTLPHWFGKLRLVLTAGAVLAMLAAAARTF
jgi:hypothetical protein